MCIWNSGKLSVDCFPVTISGTLFHLRSRQYVPDTESNHLEATATVAVLNPGQDHMRNDMKDQDMKPSTHLGLALLAPDYLSWKFASISKEWLCGGR